MDYFSLKLKEYYWVKEFSIHRDYKNTNYKKVFISRQNQTQEC